MAERFDLDLPGAPGRFVDIVVLQNGRLLVEGMACDQSDVFDADALGVELGSQGMAERMRSNAFAKA